MKKVSWQWYVLWRQRWNNGNGKGRWWLFIRIQQKKMYLRRLIFYPTLTNKNARWYASITNLYQFLNGFLTFVFFQLSTCKTNSVWPSSSLRLTITYHGRPSVSRMTRWMKNAFFFFRPSIPARISFKLYINIFFFFVHQFISLKNNKKGAFASKRSTD